MIRWQLRIGGEAEGQFRGASPLKVGCVLQMQMQIDLEIDSEPDSAILRTHTKRHSEHGGHRRNESEGTNIIETHDEVIVCRKQLGPRTSKDKEFDQRVPKISLFSVSSYNIALYRP